jgi:hypothetical protein
VPNSTVAELRPKLTKATKLASELLIATGTSCLRIVTLAGHAGHCRVTSGTIEDRDAKGTRLWFRSSRKANKVLAELHEIHGGRQSDDGVVIKATQDETDRMLRASAGLLGFGISDDEVIDALAASLTKRAGDAIKKMGRRKGTMQALRGVTGADLTGLLDRQAFY